MKDIITDILPEEDEVEVTVMKNGPFTEEDMEIMYLEQNGIRLLQLLKEWKQYKIYIF
jgi:hypothetical protein